MTCNHRLGGASPRPNMTSNAPWDPSAGNISGLTIITWFWLAEIRIVGAVGQVYKEQ
jgi:hypothetical protein